MVDVVRVTTEDVDMGPADLKVDAEGAAEEGVEAEV